MDTLPQTPTRPEPHEDPYAKSDPAIAARVQIWLILSFLALAIGGSVLGTTRLITGTFLKDQDLLVAVIVLAGSVLIAARPAVLMRLWRERSVSSPYPIGAIALSVFIVAGLGAHWVFQGFALSMDEYWAQAEGEIFARGVPMASVPEEWRAYAEALNPAFLRWLPEEGLWASTYLPINSALQYLGGSLASPAMAAGSVVMVALIARTLMPEQPLAPVIAAILLATSSQVLVTAMTHYAMTAHLFFDLVWLWLFIQRRVWAYALSLPIALLAMGLHQEAFFPLFALPFLLERFLSRQWLGSIAYGIFLAAGFLAWTNYDLWVYDWFGAAAPVAQASGSSRELGDLITRVFAIDMQSVALMGANLTRFVLWQNPLVMILVVLGAWPVARLAKGTPPELRAMLLSLVGTIVFLWLVIPFQGHGWGYRYLHGQMAGAVLIATFVFCRLMQAEKGREWQALLVGMTGLALLLVPVRAWQARDFAFPYATTHVALLEWTDADVIIIDAPEYTYTADLTRNDLWLRNPIKRMDGGLLSADQVQQLCAAYRVRFFTGEEAERFGITPFPDAHLRTRYFPDGCSGASGASGVGGT